MINKQFFQDANGSFSSKRLGFFSCLITAIISTCITLIVFLLKDQYELSLRLIDSVWMGAFGFGGLVASEIFKKK